MASEGKTMGLWVSSEDERIGGYHSMSKGILCWMRRWEKRQKSKTRPRKTCSVGYNKKKALKG